MLDVEYYSVRLLWKIGLGVEAGALTAGVTVTTPSVNLFGSGSAYCLAAYNGVTTNPNGPFTRTLVSANQEDLSARYNSSWAIGARCRLGSARLHLSAE